MPKAVRRVINKTSKDREDLLESARDEASGGKDDSFQSEEIESDSDDGLTEKQIKTKLAKSRETNGLYIELQNHEELYKKLTTSPVLKTTLTRFCEFLVKNQVASWEEFIDFESYKLRPEKQRPLAEHILKFEKKMSSKNTKLDLGVFAALWKELYEHRWGKELINQLTEDKTKPKEIESLEGLLNKILIWLVAKNDTFDESTVLTHQKEISKALKPNDKQFAKLVPLIGSLNQNARQIFNELIVLEEVKSLYQPNLRLRGLSGFLASKGIESIDELADRKLCADYLSEFLTTPEAGNGSLVVVVWQTLHMHECDIALKGYFAKQKGDDGKKKGCGQLTLLLSKLEVPEDEIVGYIKEHEQELAKKVGKKSLSTWRSYLSPEAKFIPFKGDVKSIKTPADILYEEILNEPAMAKEVLQNKSHDFAIRRFCNFLASRGVKSINELKTAENRYTCAKHISPFLQDNDKDLQFVKDNFIALAFFRALHRNKADLVFMELHGEKVERLATYKVLKNDITRLIIEFVSESKKEDTVDSYFKARKDRVKIEIEEGDVDSNAPIRDATNFLLSLKSADFIDDDENQEAELGLDSLKESSMLKKRILTKNANLAAADDSDSDAGLSKEQKYIKRRKARKQNELFNELNNNEDTLFKSLIAATRHNGTLTKFCTFLTDQGVQSWDEFIDFNNRKFHPEKTQIFAQYILDYAEKQNKKKEKEQKGKQKKGKDKEGEKEGIDIDALTTIWKEFYDHPWNEQLLDQLKTEGLEEKTINHLETGLSRILIWLVAETKDQFDVTILRQRQDEIPKYFRISKQQHSNLVKRLIALSPEATKLFDELKKLESIAELAPTFNLSLRYLCGFLVSKNITSLTQLENRELCADYISEFLDTPEAGNSSAAIYAWQALHPHKYDIALEEHFSREHDNSKKKQYGQLTLLLSKQRVPDSNFIKHISQNRKELEGNGFERLIPFILNRIKTPAEILYEDILNDPAMQEEVLQHRSNDLAIWNLCRFLANRRIKSLNDLKTADNRFTCAKYISSFVKTFKNNREVSIAFAFWRALHPHDANLLLNQRYPEKKDPLRGGKVNISKLLIQFVLQEKDSNANTLEAFLKSQKEYSEPIKAIGRHHPKRLSILFLLKNLNQDSGFIEDNINRESRLVLIKNLSDSIKQEPDLSPLFAEEKYSSALFNFCNYLVQNNIATLDNMRGEANRQAFAELTNNYLFRTFNREGLDKEFAKILWRKLHPHNWDNELLNFGHLATIRSLRGIYTTILMQLAEMNVPEKDFYESLDRIDSSSRTVRKAITHILLHMSEESFFVDRYFGLEQGGNGEIEIDDLTSERAHSQSNRSVKKNIIDETDTDTDTEVDSEEIDEWDADTEVEEDNDINPISTKLPLRQSERRAKEVSYAEPDSDADAEMEDFDSAQVEEEANDTDVEMEDIPVESRKRRYSLYEADPEVVQRLKKAKDHETAVDGEPFIRREQDADIPHLTHTTLVVKEDNKETIVAHLSTTATYDKSTNSHLDRKFYDVEDIDIADVQCKFEGKALEQIQYDIAHWYDPHLPEDKPYKELPEKTRKALQPIIDKRVKKLEEEAREHYLKLLNEKSPYADRFDVRQVNRSDIKHDADAGTVHTKGVYKTGPSKDIEFIGDFSGEKVTQEQIRAREKKYSDRAISEYLLGLDKDVSVVGNNLPAFANAAVQFNPATGSLEYRALGHGASFRDMTVSFIDKSNKAHPRPSLPMIGFGLRENTHVMTNYGPGFLQFMNRHVLPNMLKPHQDKQMGDWLQRYKAHAEKLINESPDKDPIALNDHVYLESMVAAENRKDPGFDVEVFHSIDALREHLDATKESLPDGKWVKTIVNVIHNHDAAINIRKEPDGSLNILVGESVHLPKFDYVPHLKDRLCGPNDRITQLQVGTQSMEGSCGTHCIEFQRNFDLQEQEDQLFTRMADIRAADQEIPADRAMIPEDRRTLARLIKEGGEAYKKAENGIQILDDCRRILGPQFYVCMENEVEIQKAIQLNPSEWGEVLLKSMESQLPEDQKKALKGYKDLSDREKEDLRNKMSPLRTILSASGNPKEVHCNLLIERKRIEFIDAAIEEHQRRHQLKEKSLKKDFAALCHAQDIYNEMRSIGQTIDNMSERLKYRQQQYKLKPGQIRRIKHFLEEATTSRRSKFFDKHLSAIQDQLPGVVLKRPTPAEADRPIHYVQKPTKLKSIIDLSYGESIKPKYDNWKDLYKAYKIKTNEKGDFKNDALYPELQACIEDFIKDTKDRGGLINMKPQGLAEIMHKWLTTHPNGITHNAKVPSGSMALDHFAKTQYPGFRFSTYHGLAEKVLTKETQKQQIANMEKSLDGAGFPFGYRKHIKVIFRIMMDVSNNDDPFKNFNKLIPKLTDRQLLTALKKDPSYTGQHVSKETKDELEIVLDTINGILRRGIQKTKKKSLQENTSQSTHKSSGRGL